jgi:hypothetical protein
VQDLYTRTERVLLYDSMHYGGSIICIILLYDTPHYDQPKTVEPEARTTIVVCLKTSPPVMVKKLIDETKSLIRVLSMDASIILGRVNRIGGSNSFSVPLVRF